MTHGTNSYPWYDYPDALGANDGEYDLDWVPMVYVTWQDGDWVKARLKKAKEPRAGDPAERRDVHDGRERG